MQDTDILFKVVKSKMFTLYLLIVLIILQMQIVWFLLRAFFKAVS